MKKVLGRSHLLNEIKHLKDTKVKRKKSPSRIMVDASTVAALDHVLQMQRTPVKVQYPSTSDYITIDELRHMEAHKPSRSKLKNDIHIPIVKIESDKSGGEKTGKRRGRPTKTKGLNLRSLMCGLCDFRAEDFLNLEAHLKTHSNKTIFECPYCNSTFSQKGNLLTHIRTHTKEKPFKCVLCDFAATQKINLQVHLRTHTKEKPFRCSLCDFSTAQKCNLISHMTRRHANVEVVKHLETCENQWGNVDSQIKYYRCNMCMFSCRLKREMLNHVKDQHPFSTCEYQTIDVLK